MKRIQIWIIKEEVAKMVGVGAIIFHDLFDQRIKNVDFSLLSGEEQEGKCIFISNSWHVETVCLLSKSEVDSKTVCNEEN